MNANSFTIATVLGAMLAMSAYAQTVNKCTLEGKITYSEMPCPANAVAATLAVPAAPTPDINPVADLARQKAESAKLEKTRLQREAKDDRAQARAAEAAAHRSKKCDKLRLSKKWADEDLKSASIEHADRARLRAKRSAETLTLECPR
jgi:hypothetical protein